MDTIKIHGKEYVTVEGRVKEAHKDGQALSITTEVLPIPNKIVIKATVVTPKGTFTGISAANDAKLIEKQSPYEVAETSAVGRALGFAGYGVINGIATADEMHKAPNGAAPHKANGQKVASGNSYLCSTHQVGMKERGRGIWDHRAKGRLEHDTLRRDEQGDWYHCQGNGWFLSANQSSIRKGDVNRSIN